MRLGKCLILLLTAAPLTLGCGGKSLEQQSGSSSGTTSSAGLGGDGMGSAGTSSGGVGGASEGGAGGTCSQYYDETGSTIQVRLINGTSQPIYLGSRTPGCGDGPELTVSFTGGAELDALSLCTPTCEDLLLGKAALCPPIACPINSATTLQPGGSTVFQWFGSYAQNITLPPACPLPDDGNQCQRVASLKPGAFYTFSAQAGTAIDCTQLGTATCPPCTEDGSNDCYTAGAVVSGTLLSAHTDVVLDASYGVGPGGASSGATRAVEVTFEN
jgi:hypothetical protein